MNGQVNPLTIQIDTMGIWHISYFVGLWFFTMLGVVGLPKQFGVIPKVLLAYVLSSALFLFEFPYPVFGIWSTAFQSVAAQSFVEIVLIIFGVWTIPAKALWSALPIIAAVEMAFIWAYKPGFMIAPSLSLALVALTVPFIPRFLQVIALITIVTHHGSTALMILAAEGLAYFTVRGLAIHYISVALFVGSLGVYLFKSLLLGMHDRLDVWQRFMTFWFNTPRFVAIGSGPGTFMWLSLMIDNFKAPMWLQLHSDFLQITFELGLVGLSLCLVVLYQAIKKSLKNPTILAGVFGTIAFSLTYHPFRFMPSAVLVAFIFKEALCGKTQWPISGNESKKFQHIGFGADP